MLFKMVCDVPMCVHSKEYTSGKKTWYFHKCSYLSSWAGVNCTHVLAFCSHGSRIIRNTFWITLYDENSIYISGYGDISQCPTHSVENSNVDGFQMLLWAVKHRKWVWWVPCYIFSSMPASFFFLRRCKTHMDKNETPISDKTKTKIVRWPVHNWFFYWYFEVMSVISAFLKKGYQLSAIVVRSIW